ncbi:MAG: topoisomerase C-terminal repeat-containing protein [Fibrobacterota bacterium]
MLNSSDPYFCPFCSRELHKGEHGWFCCQCSLTVPFVYRRFRLPAEQIYRLLREGRTDCICSWRTIRNYTVCGRLVLNSTGRLQFQAQRFAGGNCPACGKTVYRSKEYLFCEACSFRLFMTVASKRLSDTNLRELLTRGETGPVTGMVATESGKYFSARLICDATGDIRFDFH